MASPETDQDLCAPQSEDAASGTDGHTALLPAGLRDILPASAQTEAEIVDALVAYFAAHGYERVKPPLLEFEETLLSGAGAARAKETFRLMDPISQRMMGLRADMTPQIGRIATTRLRTAPRPLRLSYAGQVLRVRGGQLRPNRQFGQVGVELIGSDSMGADIEVVLLAAEGLRTSGIRGLSVDLNLPPLAPALAAAMDLPVQDTGRLMAALDHKDVAAVRAVLGERSRLFTDLLRAVGPIETALKQLEGIALSDSIVPMIGEFCEIARRIRTAAPDLSLTVDPLERRGFEYQAGTCFTIFARGVRAELGRGGRYFAGAGNGGPREPATGLTLFADTVVQAAGAPQRGRRVLVPQDLPRAKGEALRADGWITVTALDGPVATVSEARRLSCGHVWDNGPTPVTER